MTEHRGSAHHLEPGFHGERRGEFVRGGEVTSVRHREQFKHR